jgi:xanthine dehydrogenase FAD-binding subunit
MNSKAFRPASLKAALEYLAKNECLIFSGGTDLMVQYARGTGLAPTFPRPPLFLAQIPELRQIEVSAKSIVIGAAVTLSELLSHPDIPLIFKDIISQMASLPSRNTATIGGNICNASPAGDTLPYLIANDASIRLQSLSNERVVLLSDFFTAAKETILKKDEVLTKITIPRTNFNHHYYQKIGQRKGMSLTKASMLGLALIENGKVKELRIAFGAVAPLIVRDLAIEKQYLGLRNDKLLDYEEEICRQYSPLIKPIDDARSTAAYRKAVSLRMLRDFIKQLSKAQE